MSIREPTLTITSLRNIVIPAGPVKGQNGLWRIYFRPPLRIWIRLGKPRESVLNNATAKAVED